MPFLRDKQLKAIDTYLQTGNHHASIELLLKLKPAALAQFQIEYPQHGRVLREPDFVYFWQQRRDDLRVAHHFDFRFVPQLGITDADFVTGYLFYLLALKHQEEKQIEKYGDYLRQSIANSSLHALKKCLNDLVTQPQSADSKSEYCDSLVRYLSQLEAVAQVHGTPGYLLCANGYLQLAIAAKNNDDDSARSGAAFGYVWKYLHLARLAEVNSEAAIHNAYFGKGLPLSNPFKIETIAKMLQQCRELAADSLSLMTQNLIKNEAAREYRELRREENQAVSVATMAR